MSVPLATGLEPEDATGCRGNSIFPGNGPDSEGNGHGIASPRSSATLSIIAIALK